MADLQITPLDRGFIDKRRTRDFNAVTLSEDANYDTIAELKARLTALAPASYTTARMNSMTVNDLQYALRIASGDSAGIR